ncbi:sugar transferase [Pararhizobium qamdonense]|uniref:sugar transferase n=1 Tax=Pararhizobium qamdonense TaxID=3031126 RepID=UPI0023E21AD6|nr:sugar transferase [Pararhizobium qamdonense]
MTEKTLPQPTALIRPVDSGPLTASAATLRGEQSHADGSQFYLTPVRVPNLPVQFAIKRTIDATSALLGLIVLSPALTAIAVLIKLDSRGPVFVRQLHTGLDGAPFELLTFRCKTTDTLDPPFTPLGRFLTRTRLAVLPRLWNVLLGDLSLIGPRPHVPDMMAAGRSYDGLVRGYEDRNLMRPGLTGLAQTRGLTGPAGQHWMAIRQIICDADYIRNFSLFLDMKIIFHTAINAVKRQTRF